MGRLDYQRLASVWCCNFHEVVKVPGPSEMVCSKTPATEDAGRLSWPSTLQVYKEKKQHTKPPVSLLGQLLWREFYYAAAAHTPNYHQKEGNPICQADRLGRQRRVLQGVVLRVLSPPAPRLLFHACAAHHVSALGLGAVARVSAS